jgi:hypothetical protein
MKSLRRQITAARHLEAALRATVARLRNSCKRQVNSRESVPRHAGPRGATSPLAATFSIWKG